jgi:4'-phosphopantetheinyl transferase
MAPPELLRWEPANLPLAPGPDAAFLAGRAVDLWIYPTAYAPRALPAWADTLPAELLEPVRAADSQSRKESVLTWLGARLLLARYAGLDAAELRLAARGDGRKPRLDAEFHPDCSLRFNLSHSGGWTLLALAWKLEVGVDLERERVFREPLRFAKRFLHPAEADHLQLIRRDSRSEALRRLWVRKEAAAKATGYGLPLGLASFSALPPAPAADSTPSSWTELSLRKARAEGERPWTLLTLPDLPGEPLASALCVEGPLASAPHLRLWAG